VTRVAGAHLLEALNPKPPKRPLRILLMPSAYYPHVGGIEELTRQMVLALRARGHEAAVLTNRWPEGVQPSEVLDGISVTRLRFPLPAKRPLPAARFMLAAPGAALALLRFVRRWRPDVVHVVGAGPQSVYIAGLGAVIGAKVVFTAQGELTFDAHGVFESSASLRAGLRRMLRNADAVTACSAFVLRDLERFENVGGASQVIPNGVDPDEFADAVPERGFGAYVLAVGRLVPQKGFDVLVTAFASESLSALNLVIAGGGFEQTRLEALASELGISSRVHIVGSVDRSRLAQLLRGAQAFAFPSRGEAFGIALLEAMAAGVASVAAAAGGVPELARDGENALVVQPDDAEALASALARLTRDERVRRRLIAGGRATAAELAWTRVAGQYEDVYRSVLSEGDV
jgi:glycogen(starch) synthase